MLIGITDSGIGGLTTLKEMLRVRGGGDYIYLADTASCPYGNKSAAQIADLARQNALALQREGAQTVVLACNTATACAIDLLRAEFAKITFIGTEPSINMAKIYGSRLLVLATPLTLAQPRFARLLQGVECTAPDCRRLAAEIEQSYPSLLAARKLLRKILAPYAHAPFDAAVLGCTHYCLLAKDVRKTLTLPVTDGNGGVARRVRKLCGACSSPARVRLVTTSFANYRAVRAAAKDILGENVLLY